MSNEYLVTLATIRAFGVKYQTDIFETQYFQVVASSELEAIDKATALLFKPLSLVKMYKPVITHRVVFNLTEYHRETTKRLVKEKLEADADAARKALEDASKLT